jgi:ribosomal protein L7/L12
LKTVSGEDLPVTVGYRPDGDGSVLHIASRIRALLGHDSDETHLHNVRALIAAGKTIDAIRVLREEEGLSLVDAKRRVEELTPSNG